MTQKKKTGISRLLEFGGCYRWMTVVACILSGLSSVLMLCPFLCIWLVLRDVLAALPDLSTVNVEAMTLYGWMALGLAVGGFLLYSLALFFSHLGAFHTAKNMQSQILHHLASLSLGFFSQNSSGKLRKIINENTAQTENFLAHQLPDMTGSAVTAVTMLVMLLFFDWRLGGLSILLLVAGFMVQMLMTNEKSMSYMRKYQDASEQMNNEAVEYVRGIPVVKVFQQTIYSFKSFYAAIMYYKDNVKEYALSCQGPMVAFNVIINASFAVLIPAGILLISPEQYSEFLLDLIFYILFTSGSAGILNKILFSGTYRMMAQEAVRRVDSLLAETPVVEHEPSRIPNQNDVEFRDVTFTYPGCDFYLSRRQSARTLSPVVPSPGGENCGFGRRFGQWKDHRRYPDSPVLGCAGRGGLHWRRPSFSNSKTGTDESHRLCISGQPAAEGQYLGKCPRLPAGCDQRAGAGGAPGCPVR